MRGAPGSTTVADMTRRTWIPLAAVLAVALLAGLAWAGHRLYVREIRGVPLVDEWHCSEGEVPVDFAEGGSDCFSEREALPSGAVPDPFGNRPFSCDERWGWTVVTDGTRDDCLRDGRALPEGWRVR